MGCFGSSPSSSEAQDEKESGGIKSSELTEKYTPGEILGQGGSCKVIKAEGKDDKTKKFAIKIMEKPGTRGINRKLFSQEISILGTLSHPNVVNLIDSFESYSHYYVVTELATGGELFERITNTARYGHFSEKRASRLIRTMIETIKYCHSQNIVHRDIKPENFVFASHAPNAAMILIDFGCALKVEMKTEYKDLVGTPYYLAPESAAKRSTRTGEVLCKSDLWAVGVIAYIMLTGQTPFKGRRHADILAEILTKPVTFPKTVKLSDPFKDFVRKVLKKPPTRRITVDEALSHKWVSGDANSDESIHKEVLKCLKQFNYQTMLKKKVSNLLADNMGQEPRAKIKGHFDKLDKSNDGFLDQDELMILLVKLGSSDEDAKGEAQRMMEQADSGSDGKIDFEEFAAIWQRKLLTVNDKYIKAVFKVLDTNNDDQISMDELRAVFQTDSKDSEEQFQSMLEEVDENKDGFISYQEFKRAMKEKIEGGSVKHSGPTIVGGSIDANDLIDEEIQDIEEEDPVNEFDEIES